MVLDSYLTEIIGRSLIMLYYLTKIAKCLNSSSLIFVAYQLLFTTFYKRKLSNQQTPLGLEFVPDSLLKAMANPLSKEEAETWLTVFLGFV